MPAEDLVVVILAGGGRFVMQLAPDFAPVHVAGIRARVRARRFDGGAVVRVQDNYVVQWAEAETSPQPLPEAVVAVPPPEYDRPARGLRFRPLGFRDAYAPTTGHVAGWPVAGQGDRRWLVHCYGMVGVGRDVAPDTGNGAELYAVMGHAPRHLDRNLAVVGRILEGMDVLASLPRGTGPLGFHEDPARRVPLASARIAADLPAAERPAYQVLDTDSPAFAAWVRARANRRDDFFVRPAGAVDVCNAMAPVRKAP